MCTQAIVCYQIVNLFIKKPAKMILFSVLNCKWAKNLFHRLWTLLLSTKAFRLLEQH